MVLPVSPNPISLSQIGAEVQISTAPGSNFKLSHPRVKTIMSDWTNPIVMSSLRGKSWPLIHDSTYLFYAVASGSLTVPTGANFVSMKLWGGGGGAGACHIAGTCSGGGGAGAFIWGVGACSPGETLTYQVGGAGGGGLTNGGSGGGGGGASWLLNSTRGFYYLIAPGGGGGGATGNQANDTGGPGGNGVTSDGEKGLNNGQLASNGGTVGDPYFLEDGSFGGASDIGTPAYSGTNGAFLQGGLGGNGGTRPSNGGVGGGGNGGAGSLAGGVVGGGGGGGGAGYFGGGGGAHVSGAGGAGGGGGSYYGYANTQIFTAVPAFQFNNDARLRGNTMPTYPAPAAQSVDAYGNYSSSYGRGGAGSIAVGNGAAGQRGAVSLQFFTL